MAIITLDSLYYVLSCWPTLPDALSVLHGRHVDSSGADVLLEPYLHQERVSRHFGPKLLVGFRCVNTCHMESSDLSTSQSRTCYWNLVRGVPSTSLLDELIPGRDVGVTLDLASRPEPGQDSLFDLVPRVPQPHGTNMPLHHLLSPCPP
jgi:hypothetical protein